MADLFQATDLVTRNSVNARITDFNTDISDINSDISGLETKVNTARTGETLYDNTSGSTGTITLSKNIQNYDYAEITYVNITSGTFRRTTISANYSKNWEMWFARYSDSDGYVVFDLKNIYAWDKNISNHHVGYGNFNNNSETHIRSENNSKITKVVGYKINI